MQAKRKKDGQPSEDGSLNMTINFSWGNFKLLWTVVSKKVTRWVVILVLGILALFSIVIHIIQALITGSGGGSQQ